MKKKQQKSIHWKFINSGRQGFGPLVIPYWTFVQIQGHFSVFWTNRHSFVQVFPLPFAFKINNSIESNSFFPNYIGNIELQF